MDDEEFIEEEINDEGFEFGDEELEESEETTKPGFLRKPIALLILVAFVLFSFPNLSHLLSGKLAFLNENKDLMEDDIVQQCRPAVVSVEAGTRQGTGFNVSPEGTIVTNEHIVAGATKIVIRFGDGRSFISHRYQAIPGVDAAVIRLSEEARDLPVIKLSRENTVQSGDTVIIIGNPLGFEQISQRGSVGQFHGVSGSDFPVFDIRVSINPGNSGSPVINEKAEAVGIVFASAFIKNNGSQEPVALALPVQVLPPVGGTGE